MGDMLCSVGECRKPIVGAAVILSADDDNIDFRAGGFSVYQGIKDGDATEWLMLHPVCFVNLFEEIVRQELHSHFWLGVSNSGTVREALQIS